MVFEKGRLRVISVGGALREGSSRPERAAAGRRFETVGAAL